MWDSSLFIGALTPKFYVALTGTSSLISGLILIFEWWYFRKYGTSFIEQVSVSHLGPWFGAGSASTAAAAADEVEGAAADSECKVWRNPMSLLRGAEYARLWTTARRAPLTYYDMNLSAQEHQAWFGCVGEVSARPRAPRAPCGPPRHERVCCRAPQRRRSGARGASESLARALRPRGRRCGTLRTAPPRYCCSPRKTRRPSPRRSVFCARRGARPRGRCARVVVAGGARVTPPCWRT